MNGITRSLSTLVGVAAAGVLLWAAAQVGRDSTGGYWAAYAIVAAAGLVLALSQLRGRTGHPRAMFTLGFLPVLVVAGWVLIAMEPHGNWFRDHVLAWSGDIGDRETSCSTSAPGSACSRSGSATRSARRSSRRRAVASSRRYDTAGRRRAGRGGAAGGGHTDQLPRPATTRPAPVR